MMNPTTLYFTANCEIGPNQTATVFALGSESEAVAKATRERSGYVYKMVPVARVSTETRVENIEE